MRATLWCSAAWRQAPRLLGRSPARRRTFKLPPYLESCARAPASAAAAQGSPPANPPSLADDSEPSPAHHLLTKVRKVELTPVKGCAPPARAHPHLAAALGCAGPACVLPTLMQL